jgi:hypothetical protein
MSMKVTEGTPPAVVASVNETFAAALAQPETRTRM